MGSGPVSESGEEPPPLSPTPSLNLEAAVVPASNVANDANDGNDGAGTANESWLHNKARSVRSSLPKSRIARRIYRFFRGPSPRMPLPRMLLPVCHVPTLLSDRCFTALSPWLDRTYKIRGRALTVRLESTLIKYTRLLQHPSTFWIFIIAYIISFAFLARANYFLTPADSFIGCTSTYWLALDGCGLDGVNCQPFSDFTFQFRCPAQCRSVTLANVRTVGVEEPVYVPLVVGGGDQNKTYRSDSFICAAAVHAYVSLYALAVRLLTQTPQGYHPRLTRRMRNRQFGRKLYELPILHCERDNLHRLPISLSILFPHHVGYDTLTVLRPTERSSRIRYHGHSFHLPCPPPTATLPFLDPGLRRVLACRAVLGPC